MESPVKLPKEVLQSDRLANRVVEPIPEAAAAAEMSAAQAEAATTADSDLAVCSALESPLDERNSVDDRHQPEALVGAEWFILTSCLPYVTPHLPGIGGTIKQTPSHFNVHENLAVIGNNKRDPSTGRCHYLCQVTRSGMTTVDVQAKLAEATGNKPADIGMCGLKDKHARCTQTFSIPSYHNPSKKMLTEPELKAMVEAVDGLEINTIQVHSAKLRRNDHSGNTFTIILTNLEGTISTCLSRAHAIIDSLRTTGWPNYYGEQRFSGKGGGALRGMKLLKTFQEGTGKDKKKAKTQLQSSQIGKFMADAFRSMMFNVWLARRIQTNDFSHFLAGDLAVRPFGDPPPATDRYGPDAAADSGESRRQKKQKQWKKKRGRGREDENPKVTVTEIDEPDNFQRKLETGELTFSGPMFGSRGVKPSGAPLLAENAIFELSGVREYTYAQFNIFGDRRPAKMPVNEEMGLSVNACDEGLTFKFTLPTGAYATTVLREFVKGSVGQDAEEGVSGEGNLDDETGVPITGAPVEVEGAIGEGQEDEKEVNNEHIEAEILGGDMDDRVESKKPKLE